MHYSDDEHQWEIQQSHEVVSKFKLTKGENGIMKPNEQTEQNDSQPVNIGASPFLVQFLYLITPNFSKSVWSTAHISAPLTGY